MKVIKYTELRKQPNVQGTVIRQHTNSKALNDQRTTKNDT